MEILKKQYKNIILVSIYTIVAIAVYTIWAHSVWGLWYVDLIVGFAILAIGVVVGYFYIKSELKKESISEVKVETVADSPSNDANESNVEEKNSIENQQ